MFVGKRAYEVVQDTLKRLVDREAERLALRSSDTGQVRLFPGHEDGVYLFRRSGMGRTNMVAAVPMLKLLGRLPDGAGSVVVGKALDKGIADLRLRPFPANSGSHLQAGDVFGPGRVEKILVGRDYESAKDGDDARVIDRATLARDGDAVVVTFREKEGGFWRRGGMVARALPREFRQVTERRRFRRMFAGVEGAFVREMACLGEGAGSVERALDLHRLRTAVRRMLELVSSPQDDPLRSEQAMLRMRRRDIDAATDAETGPETFRVSLLSEREEVVARIRELGETIKSDDDRDWKVARSPGP